MGQILNITSLANDAGITVNTVKAWLSLLEASFIIYLLQPYYNNFNKRLIKAPKLYFYDTGVVSSLLKIGNSETLRYHYAYGALFENLIISEIIKKQYHLGKRPSVYYWRESNGTEIDCIIEREQGKITALEIKAGQTFNNDYIKNLKKLPEKGDKISIEKMLVFNGDASIKSSGINIVSWYDFKDVIDKIIT